MQHRSYAYSLTCVFNKIQNVKYNIFSNQGFFFCLFFFFAKVNGGICGQALMLSFYKIERIHQSGMNVNTPSGNIAESHVVNASHITLFTQLFQVPSQTLGGVANLNVKCSPSLRAGTFSHTTTKNIQARSTDGKDIGGTTLLRDIPQKFLL